MQQTMILMGMPITVEIIENFANQEIMDKVFDYFKYIDDKFSTYKESSEITAFNIGKITERDFSEDMRTVFYLCEKTKNDTDGYFDIFHNGKYDPSGLVKGWSIYNAARIISKDGFNNFYIEAGGDIQVSGKNAAGENWRVGIRSPFNNEEIIKVVQLANQGIATSGTYIRGQHIYNPKASIDMQGEIKDIVSLSVIGPNVYEADRFATAAFAMGTCGVNFIENLPGFEAYMIDRKGIATMTSGFEKYVC